MAERLPLPALPADAGDWCLGEWFSAQQLAGMPGLPGTERGVLKSAQKNLWPNRKKLRGKGLEYPYTALPDATRRHIDGLRWALVRAGQAAEAAKVLAQASPTASASAALTPSRGVRGDTALAARTPRALPARSAITELDRDRRDAVAILCRAVEVEAMDAGISLSLACHTLAGRLCRRECDPVVQKSAETAYIKARGGEYLGGAGAMQSRLTRHMAAFRRGAGEGDLTRYLVPGRPVKQAPDARLLGIFLRAWCRPSRPPVAQVLREIEPVLLQSGLNVPSYTSAHRMVARLPVTIKHRGRMTGSEFKALLPYIERDASQLKSNDVWVGDGHSFKAKVRHPVHGQPFTPEVTFILDWVSRKVVGWSVDLAESTIAVSAAFRHAQKITRARPLIYYSDNGSGQTGKMLDHDITGTLTRQGIAHHTGIPGNPQGRGIIERVWDITLIRLARSYPTCTWRGSDDLTRNRTLKALQKKDFGGIDVPQFGRFLDDVAACVAEYNLHHRHKSLGGKSPEEVYLDRIDPTSIQLGADDAEIDALWMPEIERSIQRGGVQLFNTRYTFGDLPNLTYEGERVRVRYDLHQASRVWIHRMDGEYLGCARVDSHKQAVFPLSPIEQGRVDRAQRAVKRGEAIIARAQAELPRTLEGESRVVYDVPQLDADLMATFREEAVAESQAVEAAQPTVSHEEAVMWFYGNTDGEDDPPDEDFEVAAG